MEKKNVSVRLPETLIERMKRISVKTGRRLESLWEEAIRAYLEAQAK